jgi:flagellin
MGINPISSDANFFKSLRSINAGEKASSKTLERLATGRNGKSSANSASFALGQELKGKIQVASSLSKGLSGVGGSVSTSLAGINALSDLSVEIEGKLFELANGSNSEAQTDILKNDVGNLLQQAQTFVSNSSFNEVNLLNSEASDVSVLAAENGDNIVVGSQSGVGDAVTALQNTVVDETRIEDPLAVIQNEFAVLKSSLSDASSSLANVQRSIDGRQDNLVNLEQLALEELGGLVDADIARETALSISQDVQSQLATQAFSIANSSTRSILGLFK